MGDQDLVIGIDLTGKDLKTSKEICNTVSNRQIEMMEGAMVLLNRITQPNRTTAHQGKVKEVKCLLHIRGVTTKARELQCLLIREITTKADRGILAKGHRQGISTGGRRGTTTKGHRVTLTKPLREISTKGALGIIIRRAVKTMLLHKVETMARQEIPDMGRVKHFRRGIIGMWQEIGGTTILIQLDRAKQTNFHGEDIEQTPPAKVR